MKLKTSFAMMSFAVIIASSAHAAPQKHLVIAPQCLLNTAQITTTPLATKNGYNLMEVSMNDIENLAGAKHHTKQPCGGFIDVTHAWNNQHSLRAVTPAKFLNDQLTKPAVNQLTKKAAYKIQYQKETDALIKTISPQTMWSNLTTLTDFHNRYANSDTGVDAANWIKAKVETMAKESGHDDVTVYFVNTGSYKQPSVVAKLGTGNEAGIVIGGHMDTLKTEWPWLNRNDSDTPHMPGADDDGSGSMTVMETARTILASGMKFKKPIYFVWYSAEELGLVGSQYVVQDFKNKHIPVAAALQLDMTGYAHQNDRTIWLMNDYVSKDLTAFLQNLITTYVKQPYNYSRCGYACSDHASWTSAGVPSAFPFETAMGNDDPYIHTANDKMEFLSLDHMTDFAKLGTAFAVELAEPVSK
ncbi:MAG TPA: M20/M25/M40 family metallo-hydrolase [Gammaproteobacteria bacterium]|jgi:leucyl aminopeptidase|nr:M20/M25/M40 family metallo-hydrolase [Gammaproteobacteria bacterium]